MGAGGRHIVFIQWSGMPCPSLSGVAGLVFAGGKADRSLYVLVHRMPYREWWESKEQLCCWPDFALLGCCLVYLHFLWGLLHTCTVH